MNLNNLPEGFIPLSEQQFTKAYIAARESAGDHWSTTDVLRSWNSYLKDPAGHFISKPEYRDCSKIRV